VLVASLISSDDSTQTGSIDPSELPGLMSRCALTGKQKLAIFALIEGRRDQFCQAQGITRRAFYYRIAGAIKRLRAAA
jgi:hypothetical protein